jgi:flagellar L-ring protein precursor FlgH
MNRRRYEWIMFVACACLAGPAAWSESLLEREGYRPLVADQRALRPGDNLTVLITESAVASTTAKTTTNKEGTVSGSAAANATRNGGNAAYGRTLTGSLDLTEEFKGGGTIERTGKLLARLTVVVEAVEPNGMLVVSGEQDIVVNEERQRIAVSGRVRPQDIGTDNTVLSTRLSQARIEMRGQGLLAEKQKPGVLTRFLSWLGIL